MLYLFSALAGAAVAGIIGAWRAGAGLRTAMVEEMRRRRRRILAVTLQGALQSGIAVKNYVGGPALSLQVQVDKDGLAWRKPTAPVVGPGEETRVLLFRWRAPNRPTSLG